MPDGLIYAKMAEILHDVSPVGKNKKNPQQGYQYRGVEDIAGMLQPLLATHGVVAIPEVQGYTNEPYTTGKGTAMQHVYMLVRWTFYAEDGSSVSATVLGEGSDAGDKAANKAMTAAQKYALTQCFTVPWGDDSEAHSPSPRAPRQSATAATKARTAAATTGSAKGAYDQPIGFGNWPQKTWRWLVEGDGESSPASPGSTRWKWLEQQETALDTPNATKADREILERVRKCKQLIGNAANRGAAA